MIQSPHVRETRPLSPYGKGPRARSSRPGAAAAARQARSQAAPHAPRAAGAHRLSPCGRNDRRRAPPAVPLMRGEKRGIRPQRRDARLAGEAVEGERLSIAQQIARAGALPAPTSAPRACSGTAAGGFAWTGGVLGLKMKSPMQRSPGPKNAQRRHRFPGRTGEGIPPDTCAQRRGVLDPALPVPAPSPLPDSADRHAQTAFACIAMAAALPALEPPVSGPCGEATGSAGASAAGRASRVR